jgi:hypothetical protein
MVHLHLLPSAEQESAFPRLSDEGFRPKVAHLNIAVDYKKYKAADVVCSVFLDYPVFIVPTNPTEDMFTVHVRPSILDVKPCVTCRCPLDFIDFVRSMTYSCATSLRYS